MTTAVLVDHGPAAVGGLLAFLAGAGAVAAVANSPVQLVALTAECVCLLVVVLGLWHRRNGAVIAGSGIAAAGGIGAVGALGYGALAASRLTAAIELLPGMVGLWILAVSVVPVRTGWARRLVAAGVAVIVLGVLASGVVHGADRLGLLVAMALAVIAWDAGEQAITLGEQIGRRGSTGTVALTHSAWSVAVGAIGVVLALAVDTVAISGLPLVGLALAVAAAVALATAAFL